MVFCFVFFKLCFPLVGLKISFALLSLLKCYYDENHIFSIEAILRQTSSLHEKKNAVYYFQTSLFVPEIFKFLKYAN